MKAVRQYGPRDLRLESVAFPPPPGEGEALLRITAVGICGSDLHNYLDGGIGDTRIVAPIIPGHEFAAVVEEVGPNALDGEGHPLSPGRRVAVEPAFPCGRCEFCERGDPNLCPHIRFCGHGSEQGALSQFRCISSRNCFPVPDSLSDAEAMLLEPLGVALHSLNLAGLRLGESAAVLGAGPIGLFLLRLLRLQGVRPLMASEPLPWRAELARRYGADAVIGGGQDAGREIRHLTGGRGVDVVFEAAWGGETVRQAVEMAAPGARIVLVGIPSDDCLTMKSSLVRRKGLTIVVVRRMKLTYPRAIALAARMQPPIGEIARHTFPLEKVQEAFEANAAYRDEVVKVVIAPQD